MAEWKDDPAKMAAKVAQEPPEEDVIYHGVYRETGGCLILTETPAGEVTGMVAHVPYHSPTGMGWGYGGSGPADCARSLLIAALPAEVTRCPMCEGTGWLVMVAIPGNIPAAEGRCLPWDAGRDGPPEDIDPELAWRCHCTGGYAHLPYQAFKWRFVASWPTSPGGWRMARSEIRAWYAEEMAKP